MGWFSTPKCPIHGIEYKIGKDDMCQQYYFCPKCRQKAHDDQRVESEIQELKKRIAELEKMIQ
jgi:hypothetical protein